MNTAELIASRRTTRKLSGLLQQRLEVYLSCLTGSFSPVSVLGKYINGQGKATVANDDLAFNLIQERYMAIASEEPFNLKKPLSAPVDVYSHTPSLYKFSYERAIEDDNAELQSFEILSPNRWILGYSGFDLRDFKDQVQQRKAIEGNRLEDYLLHYVLMHQVMESNPKLKMLLNDLNMRVEEVRLAGLGSLPFVMLTAEVDSFLPEDDIILEVSSVSGTHQFEELIDTGSVKDQPSTLRVLVESLS
ncbi:hypothetical protein ADINL_0533 [Nitrincola lacisaponensis]|uniref:Uncharacterized protein n=1 Tax=Nitrincola lacisaponensis TaxID=267850 RepID=A0A063Y5C7_9GAMM|nr:hypothetical protein [Nitrincola lacisaponensis]KDE40884.1 hypothetical protein ADINL_0533 [Nitrincola lacisaponensis]